MKRLKLYLGMGLASWLACAASVSAQEGFYIELRGPEGSESSSAPAPNAAPSITPQTPAAQSYGPIRSTDTLWGIAEKYTQAPTTVQQTMVALYYLNPRSFVRGNINNLQRGASLRLPTVTQARQRSAREAELEFGRLTKQGNRRPTRSAASTPAAQPAKKAPVKVEPKTVAANKNTDASANNTSGPAAALPPVSPPPKNTTPSGLSEPKAAVEPQVTEPGASSTPEQSEETSLTRLQLQLMDELREQVAMSNEQLVALADNNLALRQRLTHLSAQVEALQEANTQSSQEAAAPEKASQDNWLQQLISNPLNLAILLLLPALILLALFTLWWRSRDRQDIAEQEWTEEVALVGDTNDDFDDLFSVKPDPASADAFAAEETSDIANQELEQDIDEDAFARFLEEQQELEELATRPETEEQEPQRPAPEASFDDAMQAALEDTPTAEPGVEEEARFEDTAFDDATLAEPPETAETAKAPAERPLSATEDALSNEDIDALFGNDGPLADSDAEPYISVDQLMAEADQGQGPDPERQPNMDVGLDEYADVLGNSEGESIDIDVDEGGIGAQLDLARAYIEIDDIDSARDLLNEALKRGNPEQQQAAQKLLQRLG